MLGIVLVEVDEHIDLEGVQFVFTGDGSAARTVLSVIAGSLITVAGLTFSTTMVVLQLASSQFSPRILRTFFGDRVTQLTIGTYVGTFVYSILVLRAVGSFGDTGFVPRLSVTVASLLGIGAVVLLIVFLHHVSQMVQVSHVAWRLADATLARVDALYPERYGEPVTVEGRDELLSQWRAEEPRRVRAPRPGYVRRVDIESALERLQAGGVGRAAILVCPGEFAGVDTIIAELWPATATERSEDALRHAVEIASERDLDQDAEFGVRQLTDIAIKAMSPGINDPMTAITCIGYLRSILVRLAERAEPAGVREFAEQGLTVVVLHRRFEDHLESLAQIGRYTGGDAWVTADLLRAARACATAATGCRAPERSCAALAVAMRIAEQAAANAGTHRDREVVEQELQAVRAAAAPCPASVASSASAHRR